MARQLRIQYKSAFYHVMNRGNGRQLIFRSEKHYQMFLDLLAEAVDLWEIRIHAFSLLPNHYHLLIETPLANLSRAMRHINGVYTQRWNRSCRSDGHLFRGRYKAILVEDDAYLVELARYIHLNPVKARLAEKPEQHPWTSHRLYLKNSKIEWLSTDRILDYFGKRKNLARRKFHTFVLEGTPKKLEEQLESSRLPSVLGSENFEEWIHWNFVKDIKTKEVKYQSPHPKEVSEKLLQEVLCNVLDVKWKCLVDPQGRTEQKKRATAIWIYRRFLKKGYQALADQFGVRPSRISRIMADKNLIAPDLLEKVAAQI